MIGSRLVGGRYLLLDRLDRNGFGPAWRAEDRITGRTVAVTEITVPTDGPSRDRLLAEVRAAGRLRHPGVVGVLDLITDRAHGGELREYLVTEHPDARSLTNLLHDDPPSTRRLAAVGRDALAALRAVHAAGRTHGGIDPDCVLVGTDGHGLLADVGLARAVQRGHAPEFVAPERLPGDGVADTATADLWCLGAVLAHGARGRAAAGSPLDLAIAGLTAEEPAQRIEPQEADALLERAARPRSSGGDLGRNRWILLAAAGLLAVVMIAMIVWATL